MSSYNNIIVIPYRDRKPHLDYFIKNTIPLIKKHLPNSKVVVIEQNKGKKFNRGCLLNVVFKEYENKTNFFFTHDVDIIPSEEIVQNIYANDSFDIYRIKSAHQSSLGGIIKIKKNIIFLINGFPNNIWGWGIEDRALFYRATIKNVEITNNNNQTFKLLPHKPNCEIYTREKKYMSEIWRKKYIQKLDKKQKEQLITYSGLNNVRYKIFYRKNIHPIIEHIIVNI